MSDSEIGGNRLRFATFSYFLISCKMHFSSGEIPHYLFRIKQSQTIPGNSKNHLLTLASGVWPDQGSLGSKLGLTVKVQSQAWPGLARG